MAAPVHRPLDALSRARLAACVDKPTLRNEMRSALATMPPLQRAQEEELVNAAIVSDEDWQHAGTVLVFKAVRNELSVVSATNAALRAGKRVVFPRVAAGNVLSLHQIAGWEGLSPGAYGIPEPSATAPLVTPMDIDIAVVPGLAFTRRGARLGQGGGYYDRLLPQLGGISWGVAFSPQVVDGLPTETHDRPVDRVVWSGGLLEP